MNAYKTYVTVTDSQELVLSNLPFKPGQKVEVIVLAENDNKAMLAEKMRKLFKEIQALHADNPLTDAEIAAEIEAYRRGE